MSSDEQWAKSLIQNLRQDIPLITDVISSQLLSLIKEEFRERQLTKKELGELAKDLVNKMINSTKQSDVSK